MTPHSKPSLQQSVVIGDSNDHSLNVQFHAITSQYSFLFRQLDDSEKAIRQFPLPLPTMLVLCLGSSIFMIGWTLMAWLRFTYGNVEMLGSTFLMIILNCSIFGLILDLFLDRVEGFQIRSQQRNISIIFPQRTALQNSPENHNFFRKWKGSFKQNPHTGKIRIMFCFGLLILGFFVALF